MCCSLVFQENTPRWKLAYRKLTGECSWGPDVWGVKEEDGAAGEARRGWTDAVAARASVSPCSRLWSWDDAVDFSELGRLAGPL